MAAASEQVAIMPAMRWSHLNMTLLVALVAHWSMADVIWISSGGSPIPFSNVTIARVEGGQIFFRTREGNETSRQLRQVIRIAIDDEPAFNAGEEAFTNGKWDAAIDAYQKTLQTTAKPWLRNWAAVRLLDSANHTMRFDAAVNGYIAVALTDPGTALANKPVMPAPQSTFLDSATAQIAQALATRGISDETKAALLSLQLDIYRTRKDTDRALQVINQLSAIPSSGSSRPEAARVMADVKLNSAFIALEKRDYNKAIAELNSARGVFLEPAQQADALYYLAQAQHGLAVTTKTEDAIKDAANAYMRVVAHFANAPGSPHVADSLLGAETLL
jgi:tetratricopeptide (TPR) repeat protein